MNSIKERELGTLPTGKLLFKLALPAILAQVVNALYNVVDRMYIGHIPVIGKDALTGVGVTMPLIMIVSAFAALVSMGGAPRASIKMGEGKKDDAEHILGNCTSMLIFISVILTVLILLFSNKLLMLFGASENTIVYAQEYMNIYAIGTIFVQMALGLNAFITSQGFAAKSMMTVVIGAILNICLDPLFIYAFGMGVKGAALATIISQAVSCIWVLAFLNGKKSFLKIRKKYLLIKPSIILPVLALGVSPFIMQATESAIILCFNSSLYKYGGDLAVGAMAILSSMMQFSMLPLTGLTQGSQPIISYNFGAGNIDRVRSAFKQLFICALAYSMTLWILIMIVPQVFVSAFTNDAQLKELTVWAIRIYMLGSGIFGIQIACQQTFIALGNAKTSLFLAVFRKIILLIPLIFIVPIFFSDKVFGVLLAEPIADVLAVLVTSIMFFTKFKKISVPSDKSKEIDSTNADKNVI